MGDIGDAMSVSLKYVPYYAYATIVIVRLDVENARIDKGYEYYDVHGAGYIVANDLSRLVVDIAGVLFMRKTLESETLVSRYVATQTSELNLRHLAIAMSENKPILLEGVRGLCAEIR